MNLLVGVALISLMIPLRLETELVLLRPFEVLVALAFLFGATTTWRRGIRLHTGFLLLLPYLLWHVISAAVGGFNNVLRESLQVGAVVLFAFVLIQEMPRLDVHYLGRLLFLAMTAILAGSIFWHLFNGYWVGWKRLVDTRLVYIFLPVLVAIFILFVKPAKRIRLWYVWMGLAPVLLMSGERKALVIYVMLSTLLLARGRWALIVPVAAAGFAGLFLLSTIIDNPYLQGQVRTLVDPASTGNYEYVLATGQYLPGDTPSNVQRAFAFVVSRQLFDEHPITGIGTNQYVEVLNQLFPDLPPVMRLGIHGEFQRVLTENGLIGFALYLFVWAASWWRLSRLLRNAVSLRILSVAQTRVLPLLLFIPFALFVGTEAPGSRSFVALILISLLPELTRSVLKNRARYLQTPLVEGKAPVTYALGRLV